MIVNDFLIKHFEKIMDYGFTASVEEEFDLVAAGEIKRYDMIQKFYDPFHHNVVETLGDKEFVKTERVIGQHPKTGKQIIARMGRFGPLIQLGEKNEETGEKPQFAPIPSDKNIETITLEDALQCFTLPRNLGNHEGEEVLVNI
jgi:DNA topoisomerase-1